MGIEVVELYINGKTLDRYAIYDNTTEQMYPAVWFSEAAANKACREEEEARSYLRFKGKLWSK